MGANASTAVPVYASGQVLDAARLNLTNAGIPVFSGTATRDAAFGGSGEKTLAEGQFVYLEDTDALQYYSGTSFVSVGVASTSRIWLNTHNGYGSSSNKIPRFTTTIINSGSDITYADSASLGSTFTINTAGMYAVMFQQGSPVNSSALVGISLNSTQLTTNVISITIADRLGVNKSFPESGDSAVGFVTSTFYFNVSDVIRPHTNGATPNTTSESQFMIVRLT